MNAIQTRLFALRDERYAEFNRKLIPNIAPERIIGVRTPALRTLAKEIAQAGDMSHFMSRLPHKYLEEDLLQAALIGRCKDFQACLDAVNRFLPYVDNWAVCDSLSPNVFKKHLPMLLQSIRAWIASDSHYTVRFGIGMLMRYYLDESFLPEYAEMVAQVRRDDYYVRMMQAWYFATALAKQYDAVLTFIEQKRLEKWTHNKTIQKAVESYRISDDHKQYLRSLRLR